jgi:hypothetical protein
MLLFKEHSIGQGRTTVHENPLNPPLRKGGQGGLSEADV